MTTPISGKKSWRAPLVAGLLALSSCAAGGSDADGKATSGLSIGASTQTTARRPDAPSSDVPDPAEPSNGMANRAGQPAPTVMRPIRPSVRQMVPLAPVVISPRPPAAPMREGGGLSLRGILSGSGEQVEPGPAPAQDPPVAVVSVPSPQPLPPSAPAAVVADAATPNSVAVGRLPQRTRSLAEARPSSKTGPGDGAPPHDATPADRARGVDPTSVRDFF